MHSNPLYRKQATTMLLAALLPWAGNFIFLAGWSPLPHLDVTPFAFIVTCFLCAWALFRLGLLDLVPIAHASIVEGINDSIIVLDRQNRLVECNPAAQRLVKPGTAEVIGRPLGEVMPELADQFDPSLEKIVAIEDVELGEGSPRRIYELHLSPLAGREGCQIGKVLVLRDVTKHRLAEESARQQTEFLENVVESLAHPFYVLDAEDYTIKLANSAARLEDSSDASTCYSLTHGKDRPCDAAGHPCPLKQVKRTKQPMVIEHIHEQENRTSKHFQVRGYPIFDREGTVVQMIEYHLDITDRRLMEEALRESEARLRTAIESLPFDFFVLDNNGRYVMQNTACKRRWGNIIGKRPEDLGVSEENLSLWKSNNERAFQGQTVQGEVRLKTGAEEGFCYNIVAPILDQEEVKGILGVNIDITEWKKSEQALRESEARYRELSAHLEEKVKEKVAELGQTESLAAIGRMVSVVAHEARIPLQNIGMGVDLLKIVMGQDEEKKEILKEINYGVDTLNTIINELLNYSKPVKLEIVPITVQELVRQSLSLAVEKMKNVSLSVKLEQPEEQVVVDPVKVVQVLVNLLNNAADAMPEGGALSVRSSIGDKERILRFAISDSGKGIDPESLQRIFEPFFTTKARGTGLGLPICKKIIEAHHGTIRITSKAGEGTTAEIALPLADAKQP
jgi:PAS domain S-box-containing protein